MIRNKLFNANTLIKKICKSTLIIYLKEPYIESYKKVMNEKLYEMLRFVNEQKEYLRQTIFNKLTIDSDEVLNKININLNKTKESIEKYKNHFKTFKIDIEIIQFLNNYGEKYIHPLFLDIINIINDVKSNNKNNYLNDLYANSKKYEDKFNLIDFFDLSNNTYLFFENNYFTNLTEYINYMIQIIIKNI